jgi:glycosyltransferase involved in cell wall biosynthesis
MDLTSCIVSCPIDVYSGYGARSRDFVDTLVQMRPDWDIKILPQRWGNMRWGYLKEHNRQDLSERLITSINSKPDIWIQITVPDEFTPVGIFNIGVTAGIETTKVPIKFLEGINKMNLVLVSSEFTKQSFEKSTYQMQNGSILKVTTPVEVLFEGLNDLNYNRTENVVDIFGLNDIQESFLYLTVGTWLGESSEADRKSISTTIRLFCETFKNRENKPALLLKVQKANSSLQDLHRIKRDILSIQNSIKAVDLPNLYVLHGDLTDSEMNLLYNHPKVKAMLSLTKGEGFGRPLLEFSATGKPIIASNWSGQIDFLHSNYTTLLPGALVPVDPSVIDNRFFIEGASWFLVDEKSVRTALKTIYKNIKPYSKKALSQRRYTLDNFTIKKMGIILDEILKEKLPSIPKVVKLTLPALK